MAAVSNGTPSKDVLNLAALANGAAQAQVLNDGVWHPTTLLAYCNANSVADAPVAHTRVVKNGSRHSSRVSNRLPPLLSCLLQEWTSSGHAGLANWQEFAYNGEIQRQEKNHEGAARQSGAQDVQRYGSCRERHRFGRHVQTTQQRHVSSSFLVLTATLELTAFFCRQNLSPQVSRRQREAIAHAVVPSHRKTFLAFGTMALDTMYTLRACGLFASIEAAYDQALGSFGSRSVSYRPLFRLGAGVSGIASSWKEFCLLSFCRRRHFGSRDAFSSDNLMSVMQAIFFSLL